MQQESVGMIAYIEKHFPKTTKKFYQWFIENYPKYTIRSFEKMPLEERYLFIMRYLGMSLALPENYTLAMLIMQIKEAMQSYEDLEKKYTGGIVPDYMKEIEYMPYDKREKFHDQILGKSSPQKPQISLCDALYTLNEVIPPRKVRSFEESNTGQQETAHLNQTSVMTETENDADDIFSHQDEKCPY